jgi:glycosyltransferase involved in cell wall biosynthesis
MTSLRDTKLVSLIIPVYNRRDELEVYLTSVEKQTYQNYEAIVIDDCSTMIIKAERSR